MLHFAFLSRKHMKQTQLYSVSGHDLWLRNSHTIRNYHTVTETNPSILAK